MQSANHINIRLIPFLSALLVLVNGALADPPSNTNGVPSRAPALIQQIAGDLEALRPRFTELTNYSAGTNSTTRIDYRRNADYVAKVPKSESYYDVKQGGCLIAVEAWDASSAGWPGMRAGPEIESLDRTLPNGIRIMANIQAPNGELRKAVAAVIDARLRIVK